MSAAGAFHVVRCKSSFTRISDFRTSYLGQGPGLCFVAHQGDLEAETQVSIRLVVANQIAVALELEGRVQRADFDEQGNEGVLVELTPESVALVTALDARLGTDTDSTPPELGPPPELAPAPPVVSTVSGLHRLMPAITAPSHGPSAGAGAAPPAPIAPLTTLLPGPLVARLEATRAAVVSSRPRMALFVRFEVPGLSPDSGPWRACLGRVLEVVALRDGFIDTRDAGGVLVGFAGDATPPFGRAVATMLAAREAVLDEAASLNVSAQLIAALVSSELDQRGAATTGLSRAVVLKSRLQPGQLACEKPLEAAVAEFAQVGTEPFGALITDALPPLAAHAVLVGRAALLDAVERRLAAIGDPGAGLVLHGAPGSGRTAIAEEVAERGRKQGLSVTLLSAFASWKKTPGAGLAALACELCGLAFEQRATRLRPALEALQVPPPFVEAVLLATRVVQSPWGFTPGQAAHALRVLLRALAGDRAVLVIIDGLEHLDETSLEAFAELIRRPAARELTLGLTSAMQAPGLFEGAAVAELSPLSPEDSLQLATQLAGGSPGPRLASLLTRECEGIPGRVHDQVLLLEARGSLTLRDGVAELIEAPPLLDTPVLEARLALLPPESARVLEAAWCQGDSFEPSLVAAAWPRVSQAGLQRAAELRLIHPVRAKRWAFTSSRVQAAIGAHRSKERAGMHQRLAAALAQQPEGDPAELARAALEAGDGPTAVQAAQRAIDAALARRAPRDAAVALRLHARALGLVSSRVEQRLESLSGAVGCSLAGLDVAAARALADEAVALAQPTQVETAELLLALGQTLRHEGHTDHATDVVERAQTLGQRTPLEALLFAERAELAELAGQPEEAQRQLVSALIAADAGQAVSRLHGEADLPARLEARLGALAAAGGDVAGARVHFETSAARWKDAGVGQAAARALSNLASACGMAEDFEEAQRRFAEAAETAGKAGDFLFQARALLGQAKVLKRRGAAAGEVKAAAGEAWKIAAAVGWTQGRADAEALVAG